MSRYLIQNNMINFNQGLGVFTVVGTTGTPHAITLFPKESCTCPSTNRCYHVLAVRMSIGLEDINSRRKVNLTQLRRNVRSRREKKSGLVCVVWSGLCSILVVWSGLCSILVVWSGPYYILQMRGLVWSGLVCVLYTPILWTFDRISAFSGAGQYG